MSGFSDGQRHHPTLALKPEHTFQRTPKDPSGYLSAHSQLESQGQVAGPADSALLSHSKNKAIGWLNGAADKVLAKPQEDTSLDSQHPQISQA